MKEYEAVQLRDTIGSLVKHHTRRAQLYAAAGTLFYAVNAFVAWSTGGWITGFLALATAALAGMATAGTLLRCIRLEHTVDVKNRMDITSRTQEGRQR